MPSDGVLDRAMRFLQRAVEPDGLWRDFHTLAGPGSDWVTGFVATALCGFGTQEAALAALLKREAATGGWGYNRTVPADADSTAWVMRALAGHPGFDRGSRRVRAAVAYLVAHQDPASGGFRTYLPESAIGVFIGQPSDRLPQGWTSPHTCVTGAAITALLAVGEPGDGSAVRRAISFLLSSREPTGLWSAYWWTGHAYATFTALEALAGADVVSELRDVVRSAQGALADCQGPDGSWQGQPFETAFALLALTVDAADQPDTPDVGERAAAWLLRAQNADGSWPSQPMLRIPPPMVARPETVSSWDIDGEGTGVLIGDGGRVFTTAACVWALAAYRARTGTTSPA